MITDLSRILETLYDEIAVLTKDIHYLESIERSTSFCINNQLVINYQLRSRYELLSPMLLHLQRLQDELQGASRL